MAVTEGRQRARWPRDGRHVMAQYDADSVVVYQAYRPAIGQFAAAHGYFGGEFSLGRMSWVKPNFLVPREDVYPLTAAARAALGAEDA